MGDSLFLTEPEAAKLARVHPTVLRKKRVKGGGPVFAKIGRSVRYDRRDVLTWLDGLKVKSNAEARQRAKSGARNQSVGARA